MIARRTLIGAVALAGAAAPIARAQDPAKLPRVGVLIPGAVNRDVYHAFRQSLRELGYVEGRTIRLEARANPTDAAEAWSPLVADLLERGVDIIVTGTNNGTSAARQASASIPIVAATLNDPIGAGFIGSLARPGGNITGVALVTRELIEKRVQLVTEIGIKARRIAVMHIGGEAGRWQIETARAVERQLGLELHVMEVSTAPEIDAAFESAARAGMDAVVLMQSALFRINHDLVVAVSRRTRLPTIAGETGFAAAGGLMNYGPSIPQNWRRAAVFVDKLIRGDRPSGLPVEQPARYELAINLITAQQLGIEIPLPLLVRADEVIE